MKYLYFVINYLEAYLNFKCTQSYVLLAHRSQTDFEYRIYIKAIREKV